MAAMTQQFTRGGKTFTATIDPPYLTIEDPSDAETGQTIKYKFDLLEVIRDEKMTTRMVRGYVPQSGSGPLLFRTTNQEKVAWQSNQTDRDFFYTLFGESIMKFMVNGFVKYYMQNHDQQYKQLDSEFAQVFDDQGNFISENED